MASPILPTASNFSLVFFDPLALAAFSSYPFDTAFAGGAGGFSAGGVASVSYTHLRAHET